MSVESQGWGPLLIVAIMAVVTLATRWGGVFVMSFVPIGPRVSQFIAAMSGSVLVAARQTVTSAMVAGVGSPMWSASHAGRSGLVRMSWWS